MLNNSRRLRFVAHFYCDDAMIKLTGRGPFFSYVGCVTEKDGDWISINVYRFQHRPHQVGLIFAVAISLREHLRSRVWTHTISLPKTNIDRDVLYALHKPRDCPDALQLSL